MREGKANTDNSRQANIAKVRKTRIRKHTTMDRIGWDRIRYAVWEGTPRLYIDRKANLYKQDNKKQDQQQ